MDHSEINLSLTFADEKFQKKFDEQVQKEEINTMSEGFSQTSDEFGTIRYFFGGYRDGVDWDGHYIVNAFFSEENSIGLSIFKPVCKLLGSEQFYNQFKSDLTEYIEFLNHNARKIGNPVFVTKNVEQVLQNAEYRNHQKVFEN